MSSKLALVTGGSRGIGLACARNLARDGYKLVLCGRDEQQLNKACLSLEGEGHSICSVDVTAMDLTLSKIDEVLGNVVPDVIVHAVGGTMGKASTVPVGEWKEVFDLNFFAPLSINDHFIGRMEHRARGRIVHISSSAAMHGRASHPYAASKAALNRYVVDTGRRLAKSGIVVTAIMPAAVMGLENTWEKRQRVETEHCARVAAGQVTGVFQSPESIASWVHQVCGESGNVFAGCIVNADGNC